MGTGIRPGCRTSEMLQLSRDLCCMAAALVSGYATYFRPPRLHTQPRSEDDFEVVGIVHPSSIVLIVNRGAVKRVDEWLRIEEDPVARVSVVFDDPGATPICSYAHVVAYLHISLLRRSNRLRLGSKGSYTGRIQWLPPGPGPAPAAPVPHRYMLAANSRVTGWVSS